MRLIPCYYALSDGFKELLHTRESNSAAINLFALYAANWDFNEEWYLETNTDLVTALPSEVFPTGLSHFRAVGYMEGRLPVQPQVDAQWYMSTYPDVAAAILKGVFDSAARHFHASGYREGRLPADPEIDVDWYVQTYLGPLAAGADKKAESLNHFMQVGYLNGALPRPRTP